MRETPKWLPHATANKPDQATKGYHGPTRRVAHGAERIQIISDSQRKFAAQFSLSAAERDVDGAADARIPGGSRWSSRPGRPPKNPGGASVGSRWSVKSQQAQESFGGQAPVLQMSGEMPRRLRGNYDLARPGVSVEDQLHSEHLGDGGSDRRRGRAGGESSGGGGRGEGVGDGRPGREGGRGEGQHREKPSPGSKSAVSSAYQCQRSEVAQSIGY